MWRVVALGVSCFCLFACNSSENAAHQAALEHLKDPDSAHFGEFTITKDGKKACLSVNAKNSFGGYTGEHEVVLAKDADGKWQWGEELDAVFSHDECVNMMSS